MIHKKTKWGNIFVPNTLMRFSNRLAHTQQNMTSLNLSTSSGTHLWCWASSSWHLPTSCSRLFTKSEDSIKHRVLDLFASAGLRTQAVKMKYVLNISFVYFTWRGRKVVVFHFEAIFPMKLLKSMGLKENCNQVKLKSKHERLRCIILSLISECKYYTFKRF